MKQKSIRNKLVETAIDLYLLEVAVKEPFSPIRATQIAIWAEAEYECKIPHSTVLFHLKRRSDEGQLLRTVSHTPWLELHFYMSGKYIGDTFYGDSTEQTGQTPTELEGSVISEQLRLPNV